MSERHIINMLSGQLCEDIVNFMFIQADGDKQKIDKEWEKMKKKWRPVLTELKSSNSTSATATPHSSEEQ